MTLVTIVMIVTIVTIVLIVSIVIVKLKFHTKIYFTKTEISLKI